MSHRKPDSSDRHPRPILLNEQPLEDQLRLKDRALEVAAEGITIADARQADCPLIYVNQGFERLTGYSVTFAAGSNCRFLQGDDTDAAAMEEIRRAIREKRECVVEILNYRRNGEPFWNRLSITPIRDESGDVTHFVGIQSDVTVRRNAEEALRAAKARLESANNLIRRDLQLAANVQQSFLPDPAPDLPGTTVAWKLLPCDELAGDTLSVIALDDSHVAFYVLDVSGHGVQAALLSVTLNRWLSPQLTRMQLGGAGGDAPAMLSPSKVMTRLNEQFPFDPKVGQYFTLAYAVLNTSSNQLRFACAGHPPPILVPSIGSPSVLRSDNYPIGVIPQAEFREEEISLSYGDRVYLYSDGMIDVTDARDERFGESGLVEQLLSHRDASIEKTLEHAVESIKAWAGRSGLDDDVSLLGFEVDRP